MACLGPIDDQMHPAKHCRAAHLDVRQSPHHLRQGGTQSLGMEDTSVYGDLALVEDPEERLQLQTLGHCHQSVHKSETDASLEMDNPSLAR